MLLETKINEQTSDKLTSHTHSHLQHKVHASHSSVSLLD